MKRMKNVLTVISCGHAVRVEEFKIYAKRTAEMWVERYPWYYMPISLHIVLIHGWRIIKELGVPPGLLSEEAIEATHKHLKNARLNHARKMSRYKNYLSSYILKFEEDG